MTAAAANMSTWRSLGELSHGRIDETIGAQSLEGWNPWQCPWQPAKEGRIVVPDPDSRTGFRHADRYSVLHNGKTINFAAANLGGLVWRFFVPASPSDEGVFEARAPRSEGFWRSSRHADEDLPWPQPEPKWNERGVFLEMLDR